MGDSVVKIEAPPPKLEPIVVRIQRQVMVDTKHVLEAVGEAVVKYLRSLTGEMRPPARFGGGMRPAHPGHWADVTGELAKSYSWHVVQAGFYYQLEIRNSSGHAAALEAMDGFFVLTGIQEPGGPIDRAFETVIPIVAPNLHWKRR
jgi:hypothetical protein